MRKFLASLAISCVVLGAPVASQAGMLCRDYSYSYNLMTSVQTKLQDLNLKVGKVDGKWGGKTREAVAQFQASNDIQPEERGQLDEQTLHEMFGPEAVEGLTIIENPHHMPQDMYDQYCRGGLPLNP